MVLVRVQARVLLVAEAAETGPWRDALLIICILMVTLTIS